MLNNFMAAKLFLLVCFVEKKESFMSFRHVVLKYTLFSIGS